MSCWLRDKFKMAEEKVKIFDDEEKDIIASCRDGVCFFCYKKSSRYTCPRCNAVFCSASCYSSNKHVQCSEGFFKENVLGELSQRSTDPEDVQNILRMLKNLEEEAVEDEEPDGFSLEQRFANVDLDEADPEFIWKNLTQDEKREFQASLKSGYLSQSIEEWIPWWQPANVQRLVNIQVFCSDDSKNGKTEKQTHKSKQFKGLEGYPKVLHKVPQLRVPANPLIKHSIIDVLYSYAYTMRLYNGFPMVDPEQSSQTLYALSSSLSKNSTFENLESVVHGSFNLVLESKELFNSQEFSYNILLDIVYLLEGSFKQCKKVVNFVDCALSDAHRIIEKGRKAIKNGTERSGEDVKRLWLARKKLEFFLSWLHSNNETICLLAPTLRTMHFELISNIEIHEADKKKIQAKLKENKPPFSKKLIEEI